MTQQNALHKRLVRGKKRFKNIFKVIYFVKLTHTHTYK